MLLISREPRQILGFRVGTSVNEKIIQELADGCPQGKNYYTDGCPTYAAVYFGSGNHYPNPNNKKDTHIVESINSDLRRYLAVLHRKSKCFVRKSDTLKAILSIFINAYNKYNEEKMEWHKYHKDYKGDYGFYIVDFL